MHQIGLYFDSFQDAEPFIQYLQLEKMHHDMYVFFHNEQYVLMINNNIEKDVNHTISYLMNTYSTIQLLVYITAYCSPKCIEKPICLVGQIQDIKRERYWYPDILTSSTFPIISLSFTDKDEKITSRMSDFFHVAQSYLGVHQIQLMHVRGSIDNVSVIPSIMQHVEHVYHQILSIIKTEININDIYDRLIELYHFTTTQKEILKKMLHNALFKYKETLGDKLISYETGLSFKLTSKEKAKRIIQYLEHTIQ